MEASPAVSATVLLPLPARSRRHLQHGMLAYFSSPCPFAMSAWCARVMVTAVLRHWRFHIRVYPDLWYPGPPMKGGTPYGRFTVHRPAVPPDGVPGFDQLDPRRVSAARRPLRGRVPSTYGGVAARWETADRPPVYRVPALSPPDARRPAFVHL